MAPQPHAVLGPVPPMCWEQWHRVRYLGAMSSSWRGAHGLWGQAMFNLCCLCS